MFIISIIRQIASVLNRSLDEFFPDPNIEIIAEPGRYFVASAFTLAVNVIAKREVARDLCEEGNLSLQFILLL